jgi:hypothetical protein
VRHVRNNGCVHDLFSLWRYGIRFRRFGGLRVDGRLHEQSMGEDWALNRTE